MRVDGIIFDKDGTLFSFHETWSIWALNFLEHLTQGNRGRMQQVAGAIGFDLDSKRFAPDSIVVADTPDKIARVLQPFFDLELPALEAYLNQQATITPQTHAVALVPFFQELKQRDLSIGLATNDVEVAARTHLEHAEIIEYFDYIVGYDSGYGGKPLPGQCQGFLHTTGLSAERVVMVGDSIHDLQAGRAAGMQTIAVLTGVAQHCDLVPYADIVLPDIGHLIDWLGE